MQDTTKTKQMVKDAKKHWANNREGRAYFSSEVIRERKIQLLILRQYETVLESEDQV